MNVQDILAIAALGIVGGSIATKKRKEKKKENVDCCPKCGSNRVQRKKGGKKKQASKKTVREKLAKLQNEVKESIENTSKKVNFDKIAQV